MPAMRFKSGSTALTIVASTPMPAMSRKYRCQPLLGVDARPTLIVRVSPLAIRSATAVGFEGSPRSFARTFPVPSGQTARAVSVPMSACAASFMVPSPPQTRTAVRVLSNGIDCHLSGVTCPCGSGVLHVEAVSLERADKAGHCDYVVSQASGRRIVNNGDALHDHDLEQTRCQRVSN